MDGVAVEKIGRMNGVRQSTASRWLAAARSTLRARVIRILRDQFGIAPDEVDDLAALIASQLDLSVSQLLARVG